MVRRAGATPGAQLMSCLPVDTRGCGLVLRTQSPSGRCWVAWASRVGARRRTRGGQLLPLREPASWPRAPPGPKSQGLGYVGPSAVPLSLPVPRATSASVSILFIFSSLRLSPSVRSASPSLPPPLRLAHERVSSCLPFLSCAPPGLSSRAFFLPVPPLLHLRPASALASLPPSPITTSSTSQKRKKGKKIKTQKSQTKTSPECVAKCCVSWWPLCVPWPAARPPAPASAAWPARLPACPSCR